MRSVGFTFWQDGDTWLGHLDEYPDYMYRDLSSGAIPGVRKQATLELKGNAAT